MSALIVNNIISFLPQELLPHIGSKIGDGVDGEVFSFNSDKIIKISKVDNDNKLEFDKVLTYLKLNVLYPYARVYMFGYLEIINYSYYISEKLNPLTEDEWKVFHSIVSHEDRNIVKNFDEEKVKQILFGLSRGLDFDAERVTFFCAGLKSAPVIHKDMHPRNILKNENGDFKMIDFNRCYLKIVP